MTGPSERDMRRLRNSFPPPRPLRIWASAGSIDDAANRVRREWVDVTPSEQDPAVEAAINRLVARVAARTAEDLLATMTDSERGEGSYVRLGDVLAWLRRNTSGTGYLAESLADGLAKAHREGRLP